MDSQSDGLGTASNIDLGEFALEAQDTTQKVGSLG